MRAIKSEIKLIIDESCRPGQKLLLRFWKMTVLGRFAVFYKVMFYVYHIASIINVLIIKIIIFMIIIVIIIIIAPFFADFPVWCFFTFSDLFRNFFSLLIWKGKKLRAVGKSEIGKMVLEIADFEFKKSLRIHDFLNFF